MAASRVPVRRLLLAGTVALFLARLLISLFRTGPVLVADEIGYLTNARVLAGGVAGQLEIAPFYRGGYSLLLAPLVDLFPDPTTSYHLILALNAALAASVLPLLYLLLRRFAGAAPVVALAGATAGALYPALTVLSQVAMSENALFPLLCLWLLAWGGLLGGDGEGRGGLAWAAGLGAATGALWAVHNRMIVAVALTAALLLWLGLRRRLPPAQVGVALALLAAGIVGTHALDAHLIDHNYGGTAPDEASERLHELFEGHGLRTALANLVGQAWYLLAATFGLAAAVAVRAWRDGISRARDWTPSLEQIALALTVLLLLISAAAFPERTRPDMLVYGRYVEVIAPALIALGLAGLGAARQLGWTYRPLLGFALLTGAVVLIRATASDPEAANRWNVSALPFVTVQLGPAILIGAAVVAAVGAILLWTAARRSPAALGAAAAALLLAVAAYGLWNPVRSSQRAIYPAGWDSPEPVAESRGIGRLAYDLDSYDAIGLYATQWFLPDTRMVLFEGDRQAPPAPYVISSHRWAGDRAHPGAAELWSDAGRDQVLWGPPRGGTN
jgi:hypothetical protein